MYCGYVILILFINVGVVKTISNNNTIDNTITIPDEITDYKNFERNQSFNNQIVRSIKRVSCWFFSFLFVFKKLFN